ncbi:MAG: VanZ family protein [Thermoanaerobaculia bacterium]
MTPGSSERAAAMRAGDPWGRRAAAALWSLVVLASSSWPNPPGPPDALSGVPALDKLTHLLLYGVLGFLIYRAMRWPGRAGFGAGRVLAIAGALAVFGTLDEIHQLWIPGRGMEGADLLADVAGGAVGAAAAALAAGRGTTIS